MHVSKPHEVADVRVSFPQDGIESRIDAVCKKIGGRMAAAAAAGVSDDMLRRYIRGESKPSFEVVAKLAKAADVTLDWIATGEHGTAGAAQPRADSSAPGLLNEADFVYVPRYNVEVAAGYGSVICSETPSFTLAFPRSSLESRLRKDPKDLSVLSVKGDSMEGVLNDGDAILVDHADKLLSAGIYVLRIDGELIVKRVQRLPGGILEVSSANSAYRPFTINLANMPSDFAVIGRVVWFGRWS